MKYVIIVFVVTPSEHFHRLKICSHWSLALKLRKDIIDLQLYYSERVTLAMTLENGPQSHSENLKLVSKLTLTSGVKNAFLFRRCK